MHIVLSLARWFLTFWLLFGLAHGATLVPTAATWKWRPGRTEASNPTSAWRLLDFNDSEFVSAPAPFWHGDVLPGGTDIPDMQNSYLCLFLRKTFVVSNASEISALKLSALVDDGFVAWLNGEEILRVGVPGDPGSAVGIDTLAANAVEPVSMVTYALSVSPTILKDGNNILAVQVFQSSLGSSDVGFECSLESSAKDVTPPRLTATQPSNGATVEEFKAFTVTFSEPVRGVVAAHLLVNGIGASTVTAVDETTYVFGFTQPAYGTVTVGWHPAQTIVDTAEPPNGFVPEPVAGGLRLELVDHTPPSVLATQPASGATVRQLETITVLFSEPVSGVEASDLRVNGQSAVSVTQVAASQYTFGLPSTAAGVVKFEWDAGHGIRDLASTPNAFSGGGWTLRLDPDALEKPPYISEFMASNSRTLKDETGQYNDWIEIYNPSEAPLDLGGWYLTDSRLNLTRWRFPATNIAAGGFLVVFASGEDRRIPGARLHTGFQLSADGEYLALVRPDGTRVVSEFAPQYPQQVPDVSHGVAQIAVGNAWETGPSGVYFLQPTPGALNRGGTSVPGPQISVVQHQPNVPKDNEDLVVTARVRPSFHPVATVELHYKIQFLAEVVVPMLDDGAHGDGAAGDGVYGATIPAQLSVPGQMVRYRIGAVDSEGGVSRWPLFNDPKATEEYLGTIVEPTNVVSKLPVFHLFVAPNQLGGIDTESGGRVSFFHDGEFYDNIYMELRGNTSAGLNKKSHRLEFNRGHELRHAGDDKRTRKSALLAEYLDPAYLRQHLSFWFLNAIGDPAPFHNPVRVQMNGQFYQLAFHGDVIGQEQMERMGYDPRGALYKAVGNVVSSFASTGVFQKLEPDNDASRTDYLQLANGISESASLVARRRAVFDLLDVPQVINHLAGTRWCAENDDVWANMSLYRDTFGDGLWRNIPFDMNASWGQLYGGSDPLEATVDSSKSHPLYGGSSTEGNFNRIYDVIVRLPETRQMILRRQRSILDQMVQPPETPSELRIIENHIRDMTNRISAEAILDRAKWGNSPWAPSKTFTAGVGDLINQFVVPRRRHWYVTHSITNKARAIGISSSNNAGIPLVQPEEAALDVVDVDFNPTSGNQSQEYVALTNRMPYAIDITGWKLSGAVSFTFKPGTVVPSNSVVYVSPDVKQFRARTTGPRGGQGLFVVGPYSGQLSARGETIEIKNAAAKVVGSLAYAGAPSLNQRYLRVTELMYHPAPQPGSALGSEEFEYIELGNISTTETLDLAGVRFSGGVDFSFSGSAVTRLAPGAHVVIAGNLAAFKVRYPDGVSVAGEYAGRLDNGGERLVLLDATNEEILDFDYKPWLPTTDGVGYSMEIVDENAPPDTWSDSVQWRASDAKNGSPGTGATKLPTPGSPEILVQPVGQTLLPTDPVTLSLAVTNDAVLPLGIEVFRTDGVGPAVSMGRVTHGSRQYFLQLSGTDSAPPWSQYWFVITNAANPAGVRSAVANLGYLADSDGDHLPDVWELAHLGGMGAEPGVDTDGDGVDNLGEYRSGTDPNDGASVLRLDGTATENGMILRFRMEDGKTYSLQVAEDLESPVWRSVKDVPARVAVGVMEVLQPWVGDHRAFRVVTPRQP